MADNDDETESDTNEFDGLFDGVETSSGVNEESTHEQVNQETQTTVVEEADEDEREDVLTDVDEETIAGVVGEVAETFRQNQRDKREHSRTVLQMEMWYNASILGILAFLILVMTFTAGLDPLLGLTFIAGLATGFGTNSALTSLSQ